MYCKGLVCALCFFFLLMPWIWPSYNLPVLTLGLMSQSDDSKGFNLLQITVTHTHVKRALNINMNNTQLYLLYTTGLTMSSLLLTADTTIPCHHVPYPTITYLINSFHLHLGSPCLRSGSGHKSH